MVQLTVSVEGEVTLREDVLRHIGARPGDTVTVDAVPGGMLVQAARPAGRISDVFGLLRRDGGPCLSIEEMSRISADGWAGNR